MALRETLQAVRAALIAGERVDRLTQEVADVSTTIRAEVKDLREDVRELDRRVSRVEGAIMVWRDLPDND